MPLTKLPFPRLSSLFSTHLSTKEESGTKKLIDELVGARRRGYITRAELILVCRWKSPRAIHQIRRNSGEVVRRVTRAVFKTRSEQTKLELLTSLYGVSVPMASAILMLTNPKRYGVIDIRVWQLLFKMGAVSKNKRGVGFDFKQWYRYLVLLRFYARKYNVRARDIERTLFNVHGLYQRGTLYGR
jgi:hypothetical protein